MRRILHIDTEVKSAADMKKMLEWVIKGIIQEARIMKIDLCDVANMFLDVVFLFLLVVLLKKRTGVTDEKLFLDWRFTAEDIEAVEKEFAALLREREAKFLGRMTDSEDK